MVRWGHGVFRRQRAHVGRTDLRSDDQSADDLFFDRRHHGWRDDDLRLEAAAVDFRNGMVVVVMVVVIVSRLMAVAVVTVVVQVIVVVVVVVIVVVMVLGVVVVMVGRRVHRIALFVVDRDRRGMMVVFAQAPDGYTGVWRPARAAHTLHRGSMVIVLACR